MMSPKKEPTKFSLDTVKRLLSYVTKTYKIRFICILLFIFLSSAANVAGSLFLEILIDSYITPLIGVSNPVFTGLLRAIGFMGILYFAGVLSTFIYNRLMAVIGQGVQKQIRDEMFEGMQKLPVKYFDTNSYGDIMSRYTNDIDTLRQMISQSIPMIFSCLITVILVFCAMLYSSVILTVIVVLMVSFMMIIARTVAGKSGTFFIKQQNDLGDVNGYIEEIINGQKVVKVFNYEDESKKQFSNKVNDLFDSSYSANSFANALMPIMVNLSTLTYIVVAIAGGVLAITGIGSLTLGTISTFLQLTKSFSQPISQISQQLNSITMALAGAERIFNLMDEQPEQDEGYVTLVNAEWDSDGQLIETEQQTGTWAWKHPHQDGSITYTKVQGDVRFFDVDFSYDNENTVLYNISLYAKPGHKLAFVGTTGAGKTTMTNLINRFYDVDDGKIRYDGININKIKKNDLRRSLGIVLQDTNLFTGSVRENIRYGKLEASDEDVISAAKLAGAHGFISRLPDGYDTMLTGNGGSLSQGQKQLIAIARAAIANPPVMIMDEATSSIDTRTEKLVQGGMDALMEGRTVFAIAHRLSTIKNAKAIVVLDHGHIIEKGNHDELIEQQGKYYQLYTGSFETADEMAVEYAMSTGDH